MSKISIEAKKAVFNLAPNKYYHLYLVYEDDAGKESVIRGGPGDDSPSTIVTEAGSDMSPGSSKDYRAPDDADKRFAAQIDLDGRDPESVWDIMVDQARAIDDADIDYGALINAQNSNSVVASVLDAVGIKASSAVAEMPKPPNFKVPGLAKLLSVTSTLEGGDHNDKIYGWDRDDRLFGGRGADELYGERGNDVLNGGFDYDLLNGGAGVDTADYSYQSNGLNIDLSKGKVRNQTDDPRDKIVEKVISIENVIGGSGDDTLIGSSAKNVLSGGPGDDVLRGGAGRDTLEGGPGADSFFPDRIDRVIDFDEGQGDAIFIA